MIGRILGHLLTRGHIPDWLLYTAMKTPDEPIYTPTGELYMERYWLFNKVADRKRKYNWIPFSIRLHMIHLPDNDRHYHDHPWHAVTCVLRGGYTETRLEPQYPDYEHLPVAEYCADYEAMVAVTRHVVPGQFIALGHDRYHRITALTHGPALTFFMFGEWKGVWGFLVHGLKMPHTVYREQFKRK